MSAPDKNKTPEPAANAVSSRVWFSVLLDAPGRAVRNVDDLGAALGSVAAKRAAKFSGRLLSLVFAPDSKLVRRATVADDEPLKSGATALGPVGAHCGGFGLALGFASPASEGCCGVADVVGSGHGVWWFAGASLPADKSNLPNRFGLSRVIFKRGKINSENA